MNIFENETESALERLQLYWYSWQLAGACGGAVAGGLSQARGRRTAGSQPFQGWCRYKIDLQIHFP